MGQRRRPAASGAMGAAKWHMPIRVVEPSRVGAGRPASGGAPSTVAGNQQVSEDEDTTGLPGLPLKVDLLKAVAQCDDTLQQVMQMNVRLGETAGDEGE